MKNKEIKNRLSIKLNLLAALILFVSITCVYGETIIVDNPNNSDNVYGIEGDYTSPDLDSDLTLEVTNAGTGDTYGAYLLNGKEATFTGGANITVLETNQNNAASVWGLYIENDSQISFTDPNKKVSLNVTNEGLGWTYGMFISGDNTFAAFAGATEINVVNNNTVSFGDVSGIYANYNSDINFSDSLKVTAFNAGNGTTYGIWTYMGDKLTVLGSTDITVQNSNSSAGNIYGIFVNYGSENNYNGLTLKVINNGTGSSVGAYTFGDASLTVDGFADITVANNNSSSANIYGLRAQSNSQISFTNADADVKLAVANAGTGVTYGVLTNGAGSSVVFDGNADIAVLKENSSANAVYGLYSVAGSLISFDNAIKLLVTNDGGTGTTYGVYANNVYTSIIFSGASDIAVNKTGTGSGNIYGLYADNGSKIYFTNEDATVTLNINNAGDGNLIGIYASGNNSEVVFSGNTTINAIRSETGNTYSLYASNNGTISINESEAKTTQITGNIEALTGGNITVNFTDSDSYLIGLMNADETGIIDMILSNGSIWKPTGDDSSINNANLTVNGANIDIAFWENQKVSWQRSFRNITVTNAMLNDYLNLIVNSDVENLTADKFIISNLLPGSSDPFTTNVIIGYDPAIEKYAGQAMFMGPVIITAEELIPVMELSSDDIIIDGIGKQSIVHSVLTDFLITPEIKVTVADGITIVNIASVSVEYGNDVSDSVKTAVDLISALKWMNRILIDNGDNHLIDIKNDDLVHENGPWVKAYVTRHGFTGNFDSKISQKYFGINGGYDYNIERDNGTLWLGIMGGYLDNNTDFAYRTGNIKNIGAGLYGTWLGNGGHYFDLKLNAGKFNGNYTIIDGNGNDVYARFNAWNTYLSGEYGYRETNNNNIYIEPFAKLTLSHIDGLNYTADNSMTAKNTDMDSILFNFGITVGKKINGNNTIYAGVSGYHDFNDTSNVILGNGFAQITEFAKVTNTWFKVKAGANLKVSDDLAINFEANELFGKNLGASWAADLGVYFSF